jgi:hypothetical protein
MGRPRFVTTIAVGALLAQHWQPDALASDGITPPWLAFEWFVVEAFVREKDLLGPGPRIPGIMKAQRALANGRPLSSLSYLKTPTVFGYTGIFRRLARELRVITADGRLDDAGYELLSVWSDEQGLPGFIDGTDGIGAGLRNHFLRAIGQAMERGATTSQSADFRKSIVLRLDPAKIGSSESQLLYSLLQSRAGPPHMVGPICDALAARKSQIEPSDEGEFLRVLSRNVVPEFQALLTAIDAYEALCGLLTDSFDRVRFLGANSRGAPIGITDFRGEEVDRLIEKMPAAIAAIELHPALLEWEPNIQLLLNGFRDVRDAEQMYSALLAHHEFVQGEKPPNGKRPWFERERSDRILVRSDYVLEQAPAPRVANVHEYRIPTFSRFLADLGALA